MLAFGGPAGAGSEYEPMHVGALSEGYVLCYRRPTTKAYVDAFDLRAAESGFGRATATDGGANAAQVDGVLTLRQGFAFHGKWSG